MRITKSWLRNQKVRFDSRIKSVFAMTDDELVLFLRSMWSNIIPGTREENIRVVILLSVDEFIPSHLVDF